MEKGYGTALKNAYKIANVFRTTIYEMWEITASGVAPEVRGKVISVSELRLRRGWALSELAKLSGVSKTTLFLIESGHTPTLQNAVKLATTLGVSVYQVWKA
jgi:DNA-binding XRE family transcriptional regulator